MTKKASPAKTSTGNALAQFMILSGLTVVAYQFIVARLYASPDDVSYHGTPSPSPWTDAALEKHRAEKEAASTTEFSLFMACVGLFGLMQRKKKKRDEENAILEKQISRQRLQLSRSMSDESLTAAGSKFAQKRRPRDRMLELSEDVRMEILVFLSPEDLVTCVMINKGWNVATGDDIDRLWRMVFARGYGESGDRFAGALPRICWRQYYFLHQLSRAVEISRWLNEVHDRKCVVIQGKVYDVTNFMDSHPGGYHVLGDVLGTDASDVWEQFQHSEEAKELMKEYVVDDAVLSAKADSRKRGEIEHKTLAIVANRWHQVTWCLAHAHLFGAASHPFLELCFKFVVWRTTKKPRRWHVTSDQASVVL